MCVPFFQRELASHQLIKSPYGSSEPPDWVISKVLSSPEGFLILWSDILCANGSDRFPHEGN